MLVPFDVSLTDYSNLGRFHLALHHLLVEQIHLLVLLLLVGQGRRRHIQESFFDFLASFPAQLTERFVEAVPVLF